MYWIRYPILHVTMDDENAPHLQLFEDGVIYDTIRDREIKTPDSAIAEGKVMFTDIDNRTRKRGLRKLLGKYFGAPWVMRVVPTYRPSELLGIPEYLIFDDGRIWSSKYMIYLKLGLDSDGYPLAGLFYTGRVHPHTVHSLVAKLFVHNPDPLTRNQVNHIDGNKCNNHHSNLEWVTAYENVVHSYQMGLNPGALPIEKTHAICRMISEGVPFMKIVHTLGIDPWHVKNIKSGAYKHIRAIYGVKTKDELCHV